MAERVSPTLRVLREIRDEIKATNARLDQTNARIDQTNVRLDQTNARLDQTNVQLGRVEDRVGAVEHRQVESEMRLASEIVALAKVVGEVRDLLQTNLHVRDKVEDHEKRLLVLEARRS